MVVRIYEERRTLSINDENANGKAFEDSLPFLTNET